MKKFLASSLLMSGSLLLASDACIKYTKLEDLRANEVYALSVAKAMQFDLPVGLYGYQPGDINKAWIQVPLHETPMASEGWTGPTCLYNPVTKMFAPFDGDR